MAILISIYPKALPNLHMFNCIFSQKRQKSRSDLDIKSRCVSRENFWLVYLERITNALLQIIWLVVRIQKFRFIICFSNLLLIHLVFLCSVIDERPGREISAPLERTYQASDPGSNDSDKGRARADFGDGKSRPQASR